MLFRPDPSLWDGRYANNPWLQELPRPLTKLVWDNPLLIAPALARQLALANGDCVRAIDRAGERFGAGVDHARTGTTTASRRCSARADAPRAASATAWESTSIR